MKKRLLDIKVKIEKMNSKQKAEYIITYYWYHILGVLTGIGFITFLLLNILLPKNETLFTCVLVNHKIDYHRDNQLESQFADYIKEPKEHIVVDSDYIFSYGDIKYEGINESSYEKFFFKWSSNEIDAMIMPASFFQYCKELGGEFTKVSLIMPEKEIMQDGFSLYNDGTDCAIILDSVKWLNDVKVNENDPFLLVFPKEGKGKNIRKEFIEFIMTQELD